MLPVTGAGSAYGEGSDRGVWMTVTALVGGAGALIASRFRRKRPSETE